MSIAVAHLLTLEVAELKAKLAEVQANKDGWQTKTEVLHKAKLALADRAEKAEAEAAALRETGQALIDAADRASGANPATYEQGERLMFDCIDAGEAFKTALSQPGPGAAILEELRIARQRLGPAGWKLLQELKDLRERVRKLEAVATQARETAAGPPVGITAATAIAAWYARESEYLKRALAALAAPAPHSGDGDAD